MRSTGMRRLGRLSYFGFLALLFGSQPALAQVVAPPPPTSYQVQVRYQINGTRLARLDKFFAMTRYLESQGFKKADGTDELAEDPNATILRGTVSYANARKLLAEPDVRTLLLVPSGYKIPQGDEPVKIQIELDGGRGLARQRLLAAQTKVLLEDQGFREAVGYDNRGHTRLLGYVPASALPRLLDDLRVQTGWMVPSPPMEEMPEPIRSTWPVRVIEVVPEPAGAPLAKAALPTPAVPAGQATITPELRALAAKDDLVRMEVILVAPPPELDREWRRQLRTAAPGAFIEGRVGSTVTARAKASQALTLAQVPGVSTLRLPIRAQSQVLAEPAESLPGVLGSTGLQMLRAIPNHGKGLRIAVIDSDFRGAAGVIGKRLPATTRFVDLGSECDPDLNPASIAGDDLGSGTRTALAVVRVCSAS